MLTTKCEGLTVTLTIVTKKRLTGTLTILQKIWTFRGIVNDVTQLTLTELFGENFHPWVLIIKSVPSSPILPYLIIHVTSRLSLEMEERSCATPLEDGGGWGCLSSHVLQDVWEVGCSFQSGWRAMRVATAAAPHYEIETLSVAPHGNTGEDQDVLYYVVYRSRLGVSNDKGGVILSWKCV